MTTRTSDTQTQTSSQDTGLLIPTDPGCLILRHPGRCCDPERGVCDPERGLSAKGQRGRLSVSLRQLGCTLAPRDARDKELVIKASADLILPTERRRIAFYLLRSHLGDHHHTPSLAQLSTDPNGSPANRHRLLEAVRCWLVLPCRWRESRGPRGPLM